MKWNCFAVVFYLSLIFSSCGLRESKQIDFSVNLGADSGHQEVMHWLSAQEAIEAGLAYPESAAGTDSLIAFNALLNGFPANAELAYKVFYKNKSYANSTDHDFYGGWGYGDESFKFDRTDKNGSAQLSGGFKIVGNPRNERKYFGATRQNPNPKPDEIRAMEASINGTADWAESVRNKAIDNGVSYEAQVTKDALWMIAHQDKSGKANNRWKRNPRMGVYEFMLVVMTKDDYDALLIEEQDLTVLSADSRFVDPFLRFTNRNDEEIYAIKASNTLRLGLKLDAQRGLFINRLSSESTGWHTNQMSDQCGTSDTLFKTSHWEQFFHGVNKDYYLKNIPVSADVVSGYSQEMYWQNREKYPRATRDSIHFMITENPCETVGLRDKAIVLENPANRKENVGAKSRVGLSYGTYTLKCSFPEMLSEDGVWNGITNAFWLIYESDEDWNNRSKSNTGYLAKSSTESAPGERASNTIYSEIDIEIVKSRETWLEVENAPSNSIDKDITVSFTNWDMNDHDVEDFILYTQQRETEEGKFEYHRWHESYNAITCKQNFNHDEILGADFYYFQIAWYPDKIVWKMGPNRDHLKVFGYMDSTMTNIPDNQMVAVVTQEWHAEEWWPRAPFEQNDIPFPLNNLRGEILELSIE